MKERDLMRQKVNVTPALIQKWSENMDYNLRNLIHAELLTPEDRGRTFVHQDREFTIIGMTENDYMVLSEQYEGNTVYWVCTTAFVQMKLGLFYSEWKEVAGKIIPIEKPYETSRLLLPNNKTIRKKKEDEEIVEDEVEMEEYVEDVYEEVED